MTIQISNSIPSLSFRWHIYFYFCFSLACSWLVTSIFPQKATPQFQTTGQFYCADLIQQCAKSAAEYTEQILQYKESAFKSCVRRPACHTERKIFDECFDASVSATHISPPQESTSNDGETRKVTQPPMVKYNSLLKFFTEKSMNFRSALDQCFVRSPFVPKRNFFGPSILDGK